MPVFVKGYMTRVGKAVKGYSRKQSAIKQFKAGNESARSKLRRKISRGQGVVLEMSPTGRSATRMHITPNRGSNSYFRLAAKYGINRQRY